MSPAQCLKRILGYTRPYRARLVLGILTGFVAGASSALMIGTLKVVVDTIFPSASETPITQKLASVSDWLQPAARWLFEQQEAVRSNPRSMATVLIILLIPASMLIKGFFTYLNAYMTNWVAFRVITDLRIKVFAHVMSMPASFFTRTSTGELLTKMGQISQLQTVASSALVTIIREPITIIGLIWLLMSTQPKLTLIALSTMPLALVPFIIYARKLRKASEALLGQSLIQGKTVHESITGYRVIKAYNLEDRMTEDYNHSARKSLGFLMRSMRASELPGPIMELLAGVGVSMFLLYLAIFSDQPTPGDLILFAGSIFSMYKPIKELLRLRNYLDQAAVAGGAVFELLDTKPDIAEPVQPKPLHAQNAPIHFRQVSFSYGMKGALHDVTLTVPSGKMVALVGASGSGKTTLTNLLLRFYDPQQGSIFIGDTNIREVHSRDLRNQIAVVTQEVILFHDTIRNNILMGRTDASETEVIEAAKHAYAHEFILEKAKGYDTPVGERGAELSGGQRQRISIARAILRNAPILVLDEATNALDTEAERIVQRALDELMVGRTSICIAHRLSTVQKADLIVVLSEGRIVEQGTHSELIAKGGTYKNLYDLQFRDEPMVTAQ